MYLRKKQWTAALIFSIIVLQTVVLAKDRTWLYQVDEKHKEQLTTEYARLTRWPSKEQLTGVEASKEDTAHSREICVRWVKMVFQDRWIPKDIPERLFGVKRFWDGGDTLFAKYDIDKYEFRIADTPAHLIVQVTSRQIPFGVKNWEVFWRGVMTDYISKGAHPERYDGCVVFQSDEIVKALIQYGNPDDDSWGKRFVVDESNPTLWKCGNTIVFDVVKLIDGQVGLGDEFGVDDRFPPFKPQCEEKVKSATLKELVGFIASYDENVHEKAIMAQVAGDALEKRTDRKEALPLAASALSNLESQGRSSKITDGGMNLIRAIRMLGHDARDARAIVDAMRAVQSQLDSGKIIGRDVDQVKRVVEELSKRKAELEKADGK